MDPKQLNATNPKLKDGKGKVLYLNIEMIQLIFTILV